MKTIQVKVQRDHLESLSRVKKPVLALAELIWNGLDADADEVHVDFASDGSDDVSRVIVRDNGYGLAYDQAEPAFTNLGGSWKREKVTTREANRLLHGRRGRGRFKAFHLGGTVDWEICYRKKGELWRYIIHGRLSNLGAFEIEDEEKNGREKRGTRVIITDILKNFRALRGNDAVQEISELFALYLSLYPSVRIIYDGRRIDPSESQEHREDMPIEGITLKDGSPTPAQITVIEWTAGTQIERRLYLCDESGFTYHDMPPGIHAPGFHFTAYLKSAAVREMADDGLVIYEESHPPVKKLIEAAKESLKRYFRKRTSERAAKLVDEWKQEDVYPYRGEAQGTIEKAERQMFDICALNINEYLPEFQLGAKRSKQLSMRLLRHALETSPSTLRRILGEVLDLSQERRQELAELIEKTSLEAIISASRVVADRLDFLAGLELLVFDPVSKESLLERAQLHRIIAEHTWLFGERFNLSADDQSLTEVLRKHLEARGEPVVIDEPVRREDGSIGIVDLMLSRRIPHPNPEEREHLVIELKRPKMKIEDKAADQVRSYALAVAKDPRFRDTTTEWIFWVVSDEMTEGVRDQSEQEGRPRGILHRKGNITVWVKTWAEIIEECKARLNFFEEKLQYRASRETGLDYLQRAYAQYVPDGLQNVDGVCPKAGEIGIPKDGIAGPVSDSGPFGANSQDGS
jgi:hypothetical protein